MTESALFQAFIEHDTLTVRALLKHGDVDLITEVYKSSVEGGFLSLFVEYGQQILSNWCYISSYDVLITYFDYDLPFCSRLIQDYGNDPFCRRLIQDYGNDCIPTDSSSVQDKLHLCRSFHHLLCQHGEFHGETCFDMLTWIIYDDDLADEEDLVLDDLWFAIMYGAEDWEAKSLTMIMIRSQRKDWVLLYLSYFGLNINDEYPFDSMHANKPALLQAVESNDTLLWFLLEECDADVNVRDTADQTALIVASDICFESSTVKYLLNRVADVNAFDKKGLTALDYAVNFAERLHYINHLQAIFWNKIALLLFQEQSLAQKQATLLPTYWK